MKILKFDSTYENFLRMKTFYLSIKMCWNLIQIKAAKVAQNSDKKYKEHQNA